MKYFYFLFFLSSIVSAQIEFTNDKWFLREISYEDMQILAPSDPEIYIFYKSGFSFHFGDNPYTTMKISGCNDLSIRFNDLTDSSFNLLEYNSTNEGCDYPEYDQFEADYQNIFAGFIDQLFQYEITENQDGSKTLIITNPNGNSAIYSDQSTFELENYNWYVSEVIKNNISYFPPVDPVITINYETSTDVGYFSFINSLYAVFMTSGCNTIAPEFMDVTDSNFKLIGVSSTLIDCEYPLFENYDGLYYHQFYTYENQIFQYEITDNGNGLKILTITNPDGDKVIYNSESQLSTTEFSINSLKFYPNPVKNKLTIENPELKINRISITDASGKVWLHESVSERKIQLDLNSLSKGIYFVNFESAGKTIQTEKIIKN